MIAVSGMLVLDGTSAGVLRLLEKSSLGSACVCRIISDNEDWPVGSGTTSSACVWEESISGCAASGVAVFLLPRVALLGGEIGRETALGIGWDRFAVEIGSGEQLPRRRMLSIP